MRKVAFIIVFLALNLNGIAQKVQKKFDYAYDLYTKKKYDSALYLFIDIYNKGIGKIETVYWSYYYAGLIYLDTKNTNAAKEVYQGILSTDFESNNFDYDLWNNPFSQFKHNSCKILATLALDNNDYKLALNYIKMADKEYTFQHFCENAHISNAIHLARMYAKCYNGLGNKTKAIQILLPYCFSNNYASTSESAAELSILIKDKYSKVEIRKEVARARAEIFKEQPKCNYCNTDFYVILFDTKLQIKLSNYEWIKIKNKPNDLLRIEPFQNSFDQEEFIKKILED